MIDTRRMDADKSSINSRGKQWLVDGAFKSRGLTRNCEIEEPRFSQLSYDNCLAVFIATAAVRPPSRLFRRREVSGCFNGSINAGNRGRVVARGTREISN